MYLTFMEYQNMGGTLDESAFSDLEFEARVKVDYWTFGRLKNEETYPEELKRCMYKLIQLIQEAQAASVLDGEGDGSQGSVAAGISSMSNDGVSVSYNVLSASQAVEMASRDIEICIRQYLADVKNSLGRKVLYRGLYPGE